MLAALENNGDQLLKLAQRKTIEVRIIGSLDEFMIQRLKNIELPKEIEIIAKIIPSIGMATEFLPSDLFVMPSLSKGMSLMCIEAMQMGLPLIITKECDIDCFTNYKMGVEVEASVDSILQGLTYAFDNMYLWDSWSVICKEKATDLTWSNYEQNIAKLAIQTIEG